MTSATVRPVCTVAIVLTIVAEVEPDILAAVVGLHPVTPAVSVEAVDGALPVVYTVFLSVRIRILRWCSIPSTSVVPVVIDDTAVVTWVLHHGSKTIDIRVVERSKCLLNHFCCFLEFCELVGLIV